MASDQISNPQGFTLLELLITVTILTILVTVIFACLHMGMRAWEKGEDNAEKNQEMRILSDLIPQQIRSLYPYKFRDGTMEFLAFRGNSDSIRFISTLGVTSQGVAGLSFVSYFLDPSDGLMLCEKGILKKEMFQDEWDIKRDSIPLSPLVSGIAFEYQGEQGDWSEEWDANERGEFPRTIKLALTYRGKPSGQETTMVLSTSIMARPSSFGGLPIPKGIF